MTNCPHHHPKDGKRCEQPAGHRGSCDHSHDGKTAVRWWPELDMPTITLPDFFNDRGFQKTPKGGW